MGKIQKLSQNLINLIAAGEVVERPASALKELIENSIDAKATLITVKLENYGIDSISIKDNGIGMNKEDAILAFEQHATSKILNEEDLNNILTMGFRGEALASISSVAGSIEINTKTTTDEAISLLIKQTDISQRPSTQSDNGTTIRINNLFENVPARKKFLKTPHTEYKYLTDTFINVALPYLNIHFELYHNNKLVYKLTQTTDIKNRIFEIWGNVARNLFDQTEFDSSSIKISGVFGSSEAARKSSAIQYVYLNNRFITNKTIAAAVQEGYSGFVNKELKPTYFLFLNVNPAEVDVNVHPRKLEVKFSKSDEIFRSVLALTKKTLEKNTKSIINNNFSGFTHKDVTFKNEDIKPTRVESKFKPSTYGNYSQPVQEFKQKLPVQSEFSTQLFEGSIDTATEPSYKPYQVFNTYIIIEKEDKLVFIDQHAAAEKIMFEKIVKNIGKLNRKMLLVPEIIDLKPEDKEHLLKNKEHLEEIGFVIEDMGLDSVQVIEIPELINTFDIKHYIDSILNPETDINNNFSQFETYNGIKLTRDIYLIIATAACHSSVRAGQKLSELEMLNIIKDLNLLYNPYNCPHGRPVIWELSKYEVEKSFRRKL